MRVCGPGLVAIGGPKHQGERNQPDPQLEALAQALAQWPGREAFPLVVVADDAEFCAQALDNFLWVAFTRSDPATDVYGANAATQARHWECEAPLVIDARLKPFHAPPLEEDAAVIHKVEALAAPGGPLHNYL